MDDAATDPMGGGGEGGVRYADRARNRREREWLAWSSGRLEMVWGGGGGGSKGDSNAGKQPPPLPPPKGLFGGELGRRGGMLYRKDYFEGVFIIYIYIVIKDQ